MRSRASLRWKMIVKLTPLRLTEVTAPDWEKLTPWRDEHGRSHELIVTRAMCKTEMTQNYSWKTLPHKKNSSGQ